MEISLDQTLKNYTSNKETIEELLSNFDCDSEAYLGYGYNFFEEDSEDGEGSFACARFLKLAFEKNAETNLKKIADAYSKFSSKPDLLNLWKYTLLLKFTEDAGIDSVEKIPNPWVELENIASSIEDCVDFLRELNQAVEAKKIDSDQYKDGLISFASLYLSRALTEDESVEILTDLLNMLAGNGTIDGLEISDHTDYGSGEFGSAARCVLEEWTSVRLEIPDGVDTDEDAFLDAYDWSTAADEIVDHLG
jgi:hypothetical protein